MKEIKLTRGQVALVDDEDFEYLNQWKWQAMKWHKLDNYYATRTVFEKRIIDGEIWTKRKSIKMHRFIMKAKDDLLVDHKDGNGLNNQKSNLREATPSQNLQNRRPYSTTLRKTKFKGIIQRGLSGQWQSHIKLNGKNISLGTYATEIEAAFVYNEAAKKHFGVFAWLNDLGGWSGVPRRIRFLKEANTTSRYKGVTYLKQTNQWQAALTTRNQKCIYLGTFEHEIDATLAYDLEVKKRGIKTDINNIQGDFIKGKQVRKSSSKYPGVSLFKNSGKWSARIYSKGKRIYLGYHETPELAHQAIKRYGT